MIKPPQSQTSSACCCSGQLEITESVLLFSVNTRLSDCTTVCNLFPLRSQTCLWGHMGNYVYLFISLSCFIVLGFELEHLFSIAELNELPGTVTVSTQDPIKLSTRTIILLSTLTSVFCVFSHLQNIRTLEMGMV